MNAIPLDILITAGGLVAAGVGAYAAIRADLARLHERSTTTAARAEKAMEVAQEAREAAHQALALIRAAA